MKHLWSLSAVLFVIISCTGCLRSSTSPPPAGALFITHASPDAPALDMYVNGVVSLYNFPYGTDTGYASVNPGTIQFDFTQSGSSTPLITQQLTFESNKFYSIYVIDSLSKIKLVGMEDVFNTVSADSAQVRYFDFSPDAPFHSVTITSGADSLKYTIRGFNDQTSNTGLRSFTSLKSGTYQVSLYQPGSGTAFQTFTNIELQGGKIYTFYLKGFYNGTGAQVLGLGKIQHFN